MAESIHMIQIRGIIERLKQQSKNTESFSLKENTISKKTVSTDNQEESLNVTVKSKSTQDTLGISNADHTTDEVRTEPKSVDFNITKARNIIHNLSVTREHLIKHQNEQNTQSNWKLNKDNVVVKACTSNYTTKQCKRQKIDHKTKKDQPLMTNYYSSVKYASQFKTSDQNRPVLNNIITKRMNEVRPSRMLSKEGTDEYSINTRNLSSNQIFDCKKFENDIFKDTVNNISCANKFQDKIDFKPGRHTLNDITKTNNTKIVSQDVKSLPVTCNELNIKKDTCNKAETFNYYLDIILKKLGKKDNQNSENKSANSNLNSPVKRQTDDSTSLEHILNKLKQRKLSHEQTSSSTLLSQSADFDTELYVKELEGNTNCKSQDVLLQRSSSSSQYGVNIQEAIFTIGIDDNARKTNNSFNEYCDYKQSANFSQNSSINANMEKNVLERCISKVENEIEKSALSAIVKKCSKIEKKAYGSGKLNNFVKNTIPKVDNNSNKSNSVIKRYRKGTTKIYKIKQLRKRYLIKEDATENFGFEDIIKKVTNNSFEVSKPLLRYNSGSSISTSSSYVTDHTKSDVLSTGSKELTSPQQRLRTGFNELSKDKSLLYIDNTYEEVPNQDKENIKMKIQDIFFQVLEEFKNNKTSVFNHRRQTFDNCIFKNGILQLKPTSESSMTVISSKAQKSKFKFYLMLYIMTKIQTLLENNTKLTKREIFYQLKTLINNQEATDRAINAISCLLDVGIWALNIIAQKGLVYGNMKLLLSSGETLNCNVPGTMIPQDINDIVEVHSSAYFILVVEKESIFHKLLEEDLPNKLTRPFIMITGKGFPDLNTQLFLRKLWMVMSVPVFILVDADPHGINIMLNYRFGSVRNAHVSQYLAVPNAKWLGVYPSEIVNLNLKRQPLTERETRLVECLLRTPYMQFSSKLVEELNILLTKKYKAGIEGLMKTDNYLSDVYLPNKFFTRNFI